MRALKVCLLPSPHRLSRLSRLYPLSLCALLVACGGYSQGTAGARRALLEGRAPEAEAALTQAIDEGDGADRALLLLERAVARLRLGDYPSAARDLQEADDGLETLDYTSATAQEVSRYLFSDDAAPYRAQPFEKLLVNILGAASRLAAGELAAAKVEARRLQVYQSYAEERRASSPAFEASLSALSLISALVSAAAFAAAGEGAAAVRALGGAPSSPEGEPVAPVDLVARLAARLDAGLNAGRNAAGPGAEVMVLAGTGLVPHRRGVRVPLATALVYMDSQGGFTPEERQRARVVYAQGAVKWLNFVELVSEGAATQPAGLTVSLASGERAQVMPLASASLDALTRQAFELAQPKIFLSALTRLLTRAAVGGASREIAGRAGGGLAGLLVGLAAEGALSAADTPDTRSWTSLPARLDAYWLQLPEGSAELSWGGVTRRLSLKRGEVRLVIFP